MDSDIFESTATNEEEQYEEELTAAEVLQKLEDAWLNEKYAPELLGDCYSLFDCVSLSINDRILFRVQDRDSRVYAGSGEDHGGKPVQAEEGGHSGAGAQDGDPADQVHGQLVSPAAIEEDPEQHLHLDPGRSGHRQSLPDDARGKQG